MDGGTARGDGRPDPRFAIFRNQVMAGIERKQIWPRMALRLAVLVKKAIGD